MYPHALAAPGWTTTGNKNNIDILDDIRGMVSVRSTIFVLLSLVGGLASAPFARAQEVPDPALTAITLDQQRAALRKANAEADAAELSALKAAVPGLPTPGQAKAESGAGAAEALALSALQMGYASARILDAVVERADQSPTAVYVSAGATLPSLAELGAYRDRQSSLESALRAILDDPIAGPEVGIGTDYKINMPGAPIVAAGQIASFVLGALQTNHTASPVNVTAPTDADAVAALLWAGAPIVRPLEPHRPAVETRAALATEVAGLETARRDIEPSRQICLVLNAEVDAAKAEDKPALRLRYVRQLDQCAQLALVTAAYDAFVATYRAADGLVMDRVAKQMDIEARLAGEEPVLLVQAGRAAAGGYTQGNLFSTIGANPYHVTVASVVSWQLLEGDGTLIRAGWEPLYSGYQRVAEVDRLINGSNRVSERRHRRIVGAPAHSDDQLPGRPCWIRAATAGEARCVQSTAAASPLSPLAR